MFGKIQIFITFFIFNIYFAAPLRWPDVSDINSIHGFVEDFNYKVDNKHKISSDVDQDDKNNEIRNFAAEMLGTFDSFNETSEYKSNFSWTNFDKKLKNYRINKNSMSSLLPHIIFKTIKRELHIVESSINRFFHDKISGYIDDIESLCSFPLNHSISPSKLTYPHFKDMYSTLTNEIEDKEAKSESTDPDCDKNLFLQDLYDLSKELIRGLLLKFIRSTVAMSLKAKCQDLNIESKLSREKNYFMGNVTEFMNFARNYLQNYSAYLHACDFSYHTRDETYIELERMFQVVIHNEYYLDKEGSCAYNCDSKDERFTPGVNFECTDLDCQFMGDKLEVCELDDDVRRYQWFRDANNTAYGNDTSCSGNFTTYTSWYQWTRYCDYCVCVCTAKPHREVHNVITAISFQDQVSDTDNNKVIVDLKFVTKNNTIYVAIEEGELLPGGKIDNNSLSWKALDNCTIRDEFTACHYPPQHGTPHGRITAIKDFGYPEVLNLDDLIASTESVVTGVRFRFAGDFNTIPNRLKNGSVELQIRVTDFDYQTGKLSKSHTWISSNSRELRKELLLPRPDNPIKSPKNVPNLEENQFVKFKVSDMKKDAGQSTVPFFDARPVESEVLFPLRGVGLFHRGHDGFGGFIAFKLFIIGPHEYMNPDLGVTRSSKASSTSNHVFGWGSLASLKWSP